MVSIHNHEREIQNLIQCSFRINFKLLFTIYLSGQKYFSILYNSKPCVLKIFYLTWELQFHANQVKLRDTKKISKYSTYNFDILDFACCLRHIP